MNAQPALEENARAKKPDAVPEQHTLTGLVLFEATRFNHSDSVNVSAAGTGATISIVPARIVASGDWRPCTGDERPDGFGLAQVRGIGKDRKVVRGFVTWAAVKELVFSE